MLGRTSVAALAVSMLVTPTAAIAATDDIALRREEDAAEVAVAEDDGDLTGDTGNTGNTGDASGDSNDGTGSGYSPVSRDQDRSASALTRDRRRDGAGDRKRDWSVGHTNDSSRNDTR